MKKESFDIYIYFIILSIHLLLCQPVIQSPYASIVSIASTVVVDEKLRFRFPHLQSSVMYKAFNYRRHAAPLRTTDIIDVTTVRGVAARIQVCVYSAASAGLTMGPMGHVPGAPGRGAPEQNFFFLRQRDLVVGCTATHGT